MTDYLWKSEYWKNIKTKNRELGDSRFLTLTIKPKIEKP